MAVQLRWTDDLVHLCQGFARRHHSDGTSSLVPRKNCESFPKLLHVPWQNWFPIGDVVKCSCKNSPMVQFIGICLVDFYRETMLLVFLISITMSATWIGIQAVDSLSVELIVYARGHAHKRRKQLNSKSCLLSWRKKVIHEQGQRLQLNVKLQESLKTYQNMSLNI